MLSLVVIIFQKNFNDDNDIVFLIEKPKSPDDIEEVEEATRETTLKKKVKQVKIPKEISK